MRLGNQYGACATRFAGVGYKRSLLNAFMYVAILAIFFRTETALASPHLSSCTETYHSIREAIQFCAFLLDILLAL